MDEKQGSSEVLLPTSNGAVQSSPSRPLVSIRIGCAPVKPEDRGRLNIHMGNLQFFLLVLASVSLYTLGVTSCGDSIRHPFSSLSTYAAQRQQLDEAKCPAQPAPLNVGVDWDPVKDEEYGQLAAGRLSRAVQINTVSYDNLPSNASDAAFDGHYAMAAYYETEFPGVYAELKHDIVNVHGHLYTWTGSDDSLAPILLMAHEDTVPVNPDTVSQWSYPPWSGEITVNATDDTPGTWIWGRGSSDCKNSIVGILAAIEKLVQEGFTPERTVLIAYGFDEEIGGSRGAGPIARLIEERYGAGGVEFLIDEGFSGVENIYGSTVASLGMAEKGSVNIKLTVDTLGGHSSVPPPSTGIGYMSRFLTALEDSPFKPSLKAKSPYLKYLSCLAEYAPDFPPAIRDGVQNPKKWDKLAAQLAGEDRIVNSFLATTTAIDLIHGGVKVNALPEVVEAVVNHRISFTSSVEETKQHVAGVLTGLAYKLGFTLTVFGKDYGKRSNQHLTIEVENGVSLEPAPITPSDSSAFAFIAGTIKTVWGKDTVVSPTGMFANTDTARTWNLTGNIYRFTPALLTESLHQHTVDERISLQGHLTTTRFYYKLLRNTEGWSA